MAAGGAGIAEPISRNGAGHGHMLPGRLIPSVPISRFQVFKSQPGRFHRQRIRNRIVADRTHGIQAVGDHIKPCGSRYRRRHRIGQFRIHNRQFRKSGHAENRHLLICFMIRQYGAPAHLAAGAGGGGNSNDGQRRFDRFSFQQLHPGTVHGHGSRSAFSAVHGRTAAQGNNRVRSDLPGSLCAGIYVFTGRIRLHLGDNIHNSARSTGFQPVSRS